MASSTADAEHASLLGVGATAAPKTYRTRVALGAIGVGIAVAAAAGISHASETKSELAAANIPVERWDAAEEGTYQRTCVSGEVCLRMTNTYERILKRPIANGKYKGLLVEMHKPTRIEVEGFGDDYTCSWSAPGATLLAQQGCAVELVMTVTGRQSLTLTYQNSDGAVENQGGHGAVVELNAKYVRRELRDLTDDDREAYFDALHTIYVVEQSDGERLYGQAYKSAGWLVREHLYGAAQKECDHWHDDAGFLNHHIGITMQMEQSIQSVDGRTAAHYWDYTIDASKDEDWVDSPIFGENWFGAASPDGDLHTVTTGRWAYTPIMKDKQKSFSNITNPYGLLRSPWNTNPVPYVGRLRYVLGVKDANFSLPTCYQFSVDLTTTRWMGAIQQYVNGLLHGPVHIMIGGQWQFIPELTDFFLDEWEARAINNFLLSSKFLWRQGYVRCPESCDEDMEPASCKCDCPVDIKAGRSSAEILNVTGLLELNPQWTSYIDRGKMTYDTIFSALCQIGHVGEMFTSSAPYDPLFWPLHGMAERYVQLIRYYADEGVFGEDGFSEKWGYAHMHDVVSDTGVVCNWDGVEGMQLPHCASGAVTCSGHREDDVLPFGNILTETPPPYTNKEFYLNTFPFSDDIAYVYDQLTTWEECGELLKTTAPSYSPAPTPVTFHPTPHHLT